MDLAVARLFVRPGGRQALPAVRNYPGTPVAICDGTLAARELIARRFGATVTLRHIRWPQPPCGIRRSVGKSQLADMSPEPHRSGGYVAPLCAKHLLPQPICRYSSGCT